MAGVAYDFATFGFSLSAYRGLENLIQKGKASSCNNCTKTF